MRPACSLWILGVVLACSGHESTRGSASKLAGNGNGGDGGAEVGGRPNPSGGSPAAGTRASGGAAGRAVGAGGARASNDAGAPNAGAGASTVAGAGAPNDAAYATNFDIAESPLSEQGAWHHLGIDWTTVNTSGGIAFGTQALGMGRSGPGAYNDSYAYLADFPPDQTASAVVALATIDTSCTHEVEVLLHWSDAAHEAQGYECNVAFDGSYAQIVRWNGAVGDFTYLGSGSVPGGIHDGDTVSASIRGSHITLSVNGTMRATADDSTFATGDPGIGFWRGDSGCGTLGDYGFTSFSASSLAP